MFLCGVIFHLFTRFSEHLRCNNKPYLQTVLAFCHFRDELHKLDRSGISYTKRVPGENPLDFSYLVSFLLESKVTVGAYQSRCLTKVDASIDVFLPLDALAETTAVDLDTLRSLGVKDQLPSFCFVKPETAWSLVSTACDFSDWKNPVVSRLPHMEKLRMATTFVQKGLTHSYFVKTLQREDSEGLDPKQLSAALLVLANHMTISQLAAALHYAVFNAKFINKTGRLSVELQGLVRALQRSLETTASTFSHDAVQLLNTAHTTHGLKFNMLTLRQHKDALSIVLSALIEHIVSEVTGDLASQASELQNSPITELLAVCTFDWSRSYLLSAVCS